MGTPMRPLLRRRGGGVVRCEEEWCNCGVIVGSRRWRVVVVVVVDVHGG
jgi:hypothetical protein